MDTGLIVVICIFSVAGVCGFLIWLQEREAKKNAKLVIEMMDHVRVDDNGQKSNPGDASHPQHPWYGHNQQVPPPHHAQQPAHHGWFGHYQQVPGQHPAEQQPHPAQQGGWFHGWHYVHPADPKVPTGVPVHDSAPTWGKA